MTTARISDLVPGSALGAADHFEIQQGSNSRKATAQQIADFVFSHPAGVLPILHGGTGADNAADALVNLLPDQTGHDLQFLKSVSGVPTWATASSAPPGIDSPNGTATVSLSGGNYHVDINPNTANAFTQPQTVTATVFGSTYVAHFCDGTASAAIVGRANPAGAGGEGRIGCLNHAADFAHPSFAGQVTLCDSAFSVNANGLPIFSGAGLDVRTQLGFFGAALVGQQAANQAVTDSTGGTPSTTLAAVAGTGDDSHINDNFASLNARLAEVRALLLAYGLGS